jgi:hypothetical protein
MLPRTDGETPFTVWEERAYYARRDIAALAAEDSVLATCTPPQST